MFFRYEDTLELSRNATLDDKIEVTELIETMGVITYDGLNESGTNFVISFAIDASDPWDLLSVLHELEEEIVHVCKFNPNKEKVKEVDAT